MAHKQKHPPGKRRKPKHRVPVPGELGSFSAERLKRELDAESISHSKADGAVDIEHEPGTEREEES